MPYNGSGTYNLPSGQPVVSGTIISSTTHNNLVSDLKSALDLCVLRDGQSSTISSVSLAFDTWRNPNASKPVFVVIRTSAATDGTAAGRVDINVDESGGTTPDYTISSNLVAANLSGASVSLQETSTFYIPAGASYLISNTSNPNGSNSILLIREIVL